MKSFSKVWLFLTLFTGIFCLSAVSAAQEKTEGNKSPVPGYTFSNTLEKQQQELQTNPLLQRFHASREKLSGDPHRPIYHYVNPGETLYSLSEVYDVSIDGTTGTISGHDNIVGTDLTAGSLATNNLVNTSTDQATVTYRFTPRFKDPSGTILYCDEATNEQTITITINPDPDITVSEDNAIVCENSTVTFTIANPDAGQTVQGTWVYDVSIDGTTGTISGHDNIVGTDLTAGTLTTNNLVNTGTEEATVTYRFTPRFKDPSGTISYCDESGNEQTITITINPDPDIGVSEDNAIVCENQTVTFTLTNPHTDYQGTWVYDVSIDGTTGTISGHDNIVGTDLTAGSLTTNNLVNTSTDEATVTYRFTPRFKDPSGTILYCDEAGNEQTVTITINPDPDISVSEDAATVCENSTVTFTIANPDAGQTVQGTWVYNVSIDGVTGTISGHDNIVGTDLTAGSLVTNNLVNTGTEEATVTYRFTPRFKDPSGTIAYCDEATNEQTITITINLSSIDN